MKCAEHNKPIRKVKEGYECSECGRLLAYPDEYNAHQESGCESPYA